MTSPEPSPLPRFGIRHLLGLTAALAVASVLLRGTILEAFDNGQADAAGASSFWVRCLFSVGMIAFISSLAINLLVVGCLLIWSRTVSKWKYQPGHFLAWSVMIGALGYAALLMAPEYLPFTADTYFAFHLFSFLITAIVLVQAIRSTENARWRSVFAFLIAITICSVSTQVLSYLMQRGYPNLAYLIEYPSYVIYANVLFVSLALAYALAIDFRSRSPRHWSHWWAAISALVTHTTSLIQLVLMLRFI